MVNKKYKRYQAALAFALSLGLAFSGGVPVHADEPEDSTETVSVPTEDEENDVTVGNITITDDQLGALVDTRFTEQDVTLTVKGDIVVDSSLGVFKIRIAGKHDETTVKAILAELLYGVESADLRHTDINKDDIR